MSEDFGADEAVSNNIVTERLSVRRNHNHATSIRGVDQRKAHKEQRTCD